MQLIRATVDLLEITAVFLLAVEAIKIHNLSWVRTRALKPLLAYINPTVEFVEDYPPGATFVERHAGNLFFLGIYLFGWPVLIIGVGAFDVSLSSLVTHTVAGWLLSILGVVFAPLLAGGIIYTALVSIVDQCIRGLSWVEAHTHSGVVGLLGFVLYLIQFATRRALAL
ncbi:hypothetical protein [Halomonas aestuarii]|uniref:hypothetical protein n=1 Tax=Halomonas aestuarii TaxID=1897729 RepID=UPI000F7A13AA|nr:hypothetical protein [Halomonas aestuarii]